MKIGTTRNKILFYLMSGKKLDSQKAYKLFNTLSLQQHIHALREHGTQIITEEKRNKNTGVRYAEYWIMQ